MSKKKLADYDACHGIIDVLCVGDKKMLLSKRLQMLFFQSLGGRITALTNPSHYKVLAESHRRHDHKPSCGCAPCRAARMAK